MDPGPEDTYEVYAVCYGTVMRRYGDNFITPGDPHDDARQADFNYYVWLARSPRRTFVIDTGFDAEVGRQRGAGRRTLIAPDAALARLGVDASEVQDVIITHLHYDHVGNFGMFPKAKFHLQEREMMFATGKHMAYRVFSHSFEVKEVMEMVKRVYEGRVEFHDGDVELTPGLSLHRIGGHTDGLQSVRVYTRVGWMVLASDAAHLYANVAQTRPFPIIYDLGAMVRGWKQLAELAGSPDRVVPGHDAQVMKRYPPAPGLEEYAVRLDSQPQL
ncbi:MAG: N-acyl homoserine lactonase family protein [Burkholderiaceae bacterium]|nr:N-acyl homoserine lactonase family protein [Burkholderiaceae bacterium]